MTAHERSMLERSRDLVDRVLAAQGDHAEPELVQLQHELCEALADSGLVGVMENPVTGARVEYRPTMSAWVRGALDRLSEGFGFAPGGPVGVMGTPIAAVRREYRPETLEVEYASAPGGPYSKVQPVGDPAALYLRMRWCDADGAGKWHHWGNVAAANGL